jgi:predicted Zn-dependent peptidase
MSPAVAAQDKRRYAAALLAWIIGHETGSRYFWELVDTALAETATMQLESMDGTGVFTSYIRYGSTEPDKVMDAVAKVFVDLARDGAAEDELERARNKALSALVIKNELPMGRLIDLGVNWVYLRQYRTVAEDMEMLRAVSLDDVNSLLTELNPGVFTHVSIGTKGN